MNRPAPGIMNSCSPELEADIFLPQEFAYGYMSSDEIQNGALGRVVHSGHPCAYPEAFAAKECCCLFTLMFVQDIFR
jgi:hypothetical protein